MSEDTSPEGEIDRLAEEFTHLYRFGAGPSAEEYANRYPQFADMLLTVLPAAAMIEDLKRPPATHVTPAPESASVERLPEFIGEYRVLRVIGRGGMGVVYEARHEALRRSVAVKVLSSHLGGDPASRERFYVEAQAAAMLHHTNIVPVFGSGEYLDQCYYVMQYIPSRGLDAVIEEEARDRNAAASPPTEVTPPVADFGQGSLDRTAPIVPAPVSPLSRAHWVAKIGFQVADALAHAHAQGVLHRDIKPSNLLLDHEGTVWVADFGLAKLTGGSDLTSSGHVVGTLRYLPPERFTGVSDARGDVYSLGLTLYELLTAHAAFVDDAPDRVIYSILHEGIDLPSRLGPSVPRDLATILAKASARDPEQRYPGARDLAEDLRRFIEDRPILARRTPPLQRFWRWCRRNPSLAATTTVAVLLLVAVTAVSVIAFAVTAIANREVEDALRFEQIQRKHAEESAQLALGALNRIYATFAPTRFVVTTDGSENRESELARRTLSPEALVPLEELLKTYEAVAQSAESYAGLQEQAAEARCRIGEISQRLGRYESAAAEFRSAIRLYERLVDRDPDGFRTRLARANNELGGSLRAMQKFDDANSANEEAVRVLKKDSAEEQAPPESRYELAYAYFMIDQRNLFSKGGLPRKGPSWGNERKRPKHETEDTPPPPEDDRSPEPKEPNQARARPILESLIREHPNVPEYEFLLACCCKDTDPHRAEELLKRLIDRSPDVPDYRLQLAETLNRFGGAGQIDRVQSAIGHAKALVERYPNVPEYRAALARYLDHLGMTLLRKSKEAREPEKRARAEQSETYAREAVAIQTELYEKHPHVLLYGLWLSLMERSLGETLFVLGHDSEAWGRLESSIRRAEKLLAEHAQLEGVRTFLSDAYGNATDILRRLGNDRLATEMDRKKREIDSRK